MDIYLVKSCTLKTKLNDKMAGPHHRTHLTLHALYFYDSQHLYKMCPECYLIYFVVHQNIKMANFWIQTTYHFFILETMKHFLGMGYCSTRPGYLIFQTNLIP